MKSLPRIEHGKLYLGRKQKCVRDNHHFHICQCHIIGRYHKHTYLQNADAWCIHFSTVGYLLQMHIILSWQKFVKTNIQSICYVLVYPIFINACKNTTFFFNLWVFFSNLHCRRLLKWKYIKDCRCFLNRYLVSLFICSIFTLMGWP